MHSQIHCRYGFHQWQYTKHIYRSKCTLRLCMCCAGYQVYLPREGRWKDMVAKPTETHWGEI